MGDYPGELFSVKTTGIFKFQMQIQTCLLKIDIYFNKLRLLFAFDTHFNKTNAHFFARIAL